MRARTAIICYIFCLTLICTFVLNPVYSQDDLSPTQAHPPTNLIDNLQLAMQFWTFKSFSFFEAMDKTSELGLSWIEAYPGQKLINDEDLGGFGIGWGKTKELSRLIENIAYLNTKAGKLLAEGVKKSSEKLGENSNKFAMHEKGLEIPGYDPRGTFGMALAYATSDRGACHQRAWTAKAELYDPELDRFSFDKKAKIVKEIQDERSSFFSF